MPDDFNEPSITRVILPQETINGKWYIHHPQL